jgi:hypothetical protein
MKRLQIILACSVLFSATVHASTNISANLVHDVCTNWMDANNFDALKHPAESNRIIHYQIGIVCSNSFIKFVWKEKPYLILVESQEIKIIERSYTEHLVKEYIIESNGK